MAAGLGVADTIVEGAGVSGTPNGGIVTVQGQAGNTPIPVDTEISAAAPIGDGLATPTAGLVGAVLMARNSGVTLDMLRELGDDTDGQAAGTVGRLLVNGRNFVWNGSGFDRSTGIGIAKATPGTNIGIPRNGQARLTTYAVRARLATRIYDLSHVFGAAGRFQYLTIFHGAASTKTVRIKAIDFQLTSVSAATHMEVDLSRLSGATTPATGNPAMTPQAAMSNAPAAEATVLCLPTTQGTEVSATSVFMSDGGLWGVIGAASVVNPPQEFFRKPIWPPQTFNMEYDDPVMRAGVAEGWAVVVDVSAACTINGTINIVFTEE